MKFLTVWTKKHLILILCGQSAIKLFKTLLIKPVKQLSLQNKYENHAFIADQVKRFGTLIGITLKPVLEKISEQIENMSEEDVEKFTNKFEKLLKRVK